MISYFDSKLFTPKVYDESINPTLLKIDLLRLALAFLLCSTLFIRTYEKYIEMKKKQRKFKKMNPEKPLKDISLIKIFLANFFTIKNLIVYIAFGFYGISFLNYFFKYIDFEKLNNSTSTTEYVDLYNYANTQKISETLEILSLYLHAIFSLKFLAYFSSVRILLTSFKKAYVDLLFILILISLLLIPSALLTNLIYGKNIYEYSTFSGSLLMNMKIFVFIENTEITTAFMEYAQVYSIFIFIIFVFLIKYFTLNLILPVLVEYYREEYERSNNSVKNKKDNNDKENEKPLTFRQSKFFLFFLFFLYFVYFFYIFFCFFFAFFIYFIFLVLHLLIWPFNFKDDSNPNINQSINQGKSIEMRIEK
jgi:hypothetical protein